MLRTLLCVCSLVVTLIDALIFFRLVGTDANGFPLREEFAKSCFETLLQFSFVNGTAEVDQRVEQPGSLSLFWICFKHPYINCDNDVEKHSKF